MNTGFKNPIFKKNINQSIAFHLKISMLLLCILIFGVQKISAQEFQFGFDPHYADPQGEFEEQLSNPGIGIGFWAGYRFGNSPLMLGLDFSYTNFGIDVREEPLSTTIPDLRVEIENKYNLVNGNIFMRLMLPSGVIRPYAEGLFGFNYFFTETVLRERGTTSDGERLRDTNFEDTTMSYGYGGGLQIKVYEGTGTNESGEETAPASFYINLSGRYMLGNEAEYLQSGSIQISNGDVTYNVSRSETDLLYFKVGLHIGF